MSIKQIAEVVEMNVEEVEKIINGKWFAIAKISKRFQFLNLLNFYYNYRERI